MLYFQRSRTTFSSFISQLLNQTSSTNFQLMACVYVNSLFVWSPVICPHPNLDPGQNHSVSTLFLSRGNDSSDSSSFEHYWNKTHTIPLYLIVLLLPLLCFRSASFFARFTFLGKIEIAVICCKTATWYCSTSLIYLLLCHSIQVPYQWSTCLCWSL